jgi:hypothetical protein
VLIVGSAWIFWQSRRQGLSNDEWDFVLRRTERSIATFMQLRNERWSAAPLLAFKLLLATFGLHYYLPYLGWVLIVPALDCLMLFLLVRRRTGDLIALVRATKPGRPTTL